MIAEAIDIPRRLVPAATISLILAAVSNGSSLLTACENAGVSRTSFYRWIDADAQLVRDYATAVAAQVHRRFTRG